MRRHQALTAHVARLRWVRALTVLLSIVFVTMAVPATSAVAAAQPGVSAQLPEGFPADLRRFVATTPEFRAGPWFTSRRCADDFGGDIALYLAEVMKHQPRLLYWSAPAEQRREMWRLSADNPLGFDPSTVDPNTEPPVLPRTFPRSAEEFRLNFPQPVDGPCASHIRKWTTSADNAWGFAWASAPDPESLRQMTAAVSGLVVVPPAEAFTNPCANPASPYCEKAYFVDCRKAGPGRYDIDRCHQWNVRVADLFAGLAFHIDQNTTWLDQISRFFELVGTHLLVAGQIVLTAFAPTLWIARDAVDVVAFIADPATALQSLANDLKTGAVGLTTNVMGGLADVGSFDPAAPWFLTQYAAASGIGLVVMAFMALLTIVRTMRGHGSKEELHESLVRYLPLGLLLMVFSPAIGVVITTAVRGMTQGIVSFAGGSLAGAVEKIAQLSTVTVAKVPGGSIVGVIMFLLMVIGAFAVLFGLILQSIALPITGAVAGIAWGMLLHPKWRRKALRVPMMWLGVLLSKPLLFLLLGVVFALIDGTLTTPAMIRGGIPLLTQMLLAGIAMMIAGLAPFSLLRYAPLLPTAADSLDEHSGGGTFTPAVVGALGGAVVASRMSTRPGTSGTRQAAASSSRTGPGQSAPDPEDHSRRQLSGTYRRNQANPRSPTPTPSSAAGGKGAATRAGTNATRVAGLHPATLAAIAAGQKATHAAHSHAPRVEDDRDD